MLLNFVEENRDLINNNDWEEFYRRLDDNESLTDSNIGEFSYLLLRSGVNPLYYMHYVPLNFLCYNEKVEKIDIPSGITEIKAWAFYRCTNLKNIILPERVEKINRGAFTGCVSLNEIKLPRNMKEVNFSVFQDCTHLEKIFLPRNLRKIKTNAFLNCTSLTDIYYEGSEEDWNKLIEERESGNSLLLDATVHFNS